MWQNTVGNKAKVLWATLGLACTVWGCDEPMCACEQGSGDGSDVICEPPTTDEALDELELPPLEARTGHCSDGLVIDLLNGRGGEADYTRAALGHWYCAHETLARRADVDENVPLFLHVERWLQDELAIEDAQDICAHFPREVGPAEAESLLAGALDQWTAQSWWNCKAQQNFGVFLRFDPWTSSLWIHYTDPVNVGPLKISHVQANNVALDCGDLVLDDPLMSGSLVCGYKMVDSSTGGGVWINATVGRRNVIANTGVFDKDSLGFRFAQEEE